MSFRILVAIPLAWVAVFSVLDQLVSGTAGYRIFMRTEIELVKGMALIGCLAAALAFGRGEYMRRAWLFMGGCMLFLLLRDLTMVPAIEKSSLPIAPIRGSLVILANASLIVGILLLARAWKVAGLMLPGTRRQRWVVLLIAIFTAAALGGPGVVKNLIELLGGDLRALSGMAMSLGDSISLCLIAPVLLTALALRGGLFEWPWWLLAASLLSWLIYDCIWELGLYLGMGEHAWRSVCEMFRALACMFEFSAGLAQYHIVKRTKKDTQTSTGA
jgi:hypothetical protein